MSQNIDVVYMIEQIHCFKIKSTHTRTRFHICADQVRAAEIK